MVCSFVARNNLVLVAHPSLFLFEYVYITSCEGMLNQADTKLVWHGVLMLFGFCLSQLVARHTFARPELPNILEKATLTSMSL